MKKCLLTFMAAARAQLVICLVAMMLFCVTNVMAATKTFNSFSNGTNNYSQNPVSLTCYGSSNLIFLRNGDDYLIQISVSGEYIITQVSITVSQTFGSASTDGWIPNPSATISPSSISNGSVVTISNINNSSFSMAAIGIGYLFSSITVTYEPVVASVTAAPTPVTGLTYTGEAQTLINAGSASGGTMNYSLNGSSWSTALPTGTDWGTYTVYYKAVGDAYHTDSESGTVTAIIGKAPSYGLTVGPWTFDDVRTGWTGYEGAGTSISFNGLNDSKWSGNTYRYNDADGCGYAYLGTTTVDSKYAVYSTYTHTETVPAYTRKVLVWNYQLAGWTSSLPQTTALYAADNLAYLKTLAVDFTEDYSDATHGSDNFYHIAHLVQQALWGASTSVQTAWFGFDNRAGSTSADITDALLLTQVIGDATGASHYVHNWGGFKDAGSSWITCYYKRITYDANGGDGSMSEQEIENSGTLRANTFTRDGYVFVGWKDANGTFYRNNASITATESDKGLVTLYAQWISQDEIEQYVGKVIGADGKLYRTVTAATNAGTTASGVVAYWGVTGSVEASNSDYRGLAISTSDVATYIPWCTDPSGWFAGSTLAQALDARNGWERTNSFGRPSSRDIEDIYGHHHQHQAAAAAYDYNVSRPTDASPWFIPTMGQWNMVAQGLTGSTADISEADNPDYTYSDLSTKLAAAGATGLTWAVYWSSTEVDGTNMWTFDIGGIGSGRNGSRALSVAKILSAAEFVRACFAFESATPAVYTISYDANGGDGAPTSQTKDGGIDLTLSSTVPTRAHYVFAGWATTPDGVAAYAAGDSYPGNADQTLYAQWVDAPMASITAPTANHLTYTGSIQTLITAGSTSDGEIQYKLGDGDWSTSLPSATNAGSYTVYYRVIADDNHIDNPGSSVAITIDKAPLTITASEKWIDYGDPLQFMAATYNGFVNGEGPGHVSPAVQFSSDYTVGNNAGTYTITPYGAGAANYEISYQTGTLHVNKVQLDVTADDKSVTYGDAAPAYTVQYSGFVLGEDESVLGGTLDLACAYTNTTAVGSYPIIPSGLTATNYTFSYHNGTLTVNAPSGLVLYDNADPTTQLEDLNGSTLDVTLNRSVVAGCYNTICLPFDLSASQIAAGPLAGYSDLKAFDGADVTGSGQNLFINIYVRDVDHMEAGVPYLISYPSEHANIVNPLFNNVTFSATTPGNETHDGVTFQGMFGPVHITTYAENTTEDYLFLGANNRLLWPNDDGTSMRGFRAYFIINRSSISAAHAPRGTAARIVTRTNTTTDVENVQADNVQCTKVLENGVLYIIKNGVKYDAQGKKLR